MTKTEDSGSSSSDRAAVRHQAELSGQERGRALDIDESSYLVATNLHAAFTLMRTFYERKLADDGLSMSGFTTLWTLRMLGEMESSAVAAEVGITRPSFSGLASRLEDRGLIQRRTHPSDKRSVIISLTDDGIEMIDRVWPMVNAAATDISSHLGEGKRTKLADELRSIADRISDLLEATD